MEWFIFSFVVVFLSYVATRVKKRYKLFLCFVIAIIMGLVVGFGGLGSTDHDSYAKMFNQLKFESFSDFRIDMGRIDGTFEWGYIGLNFLAYFLGLDEAGFFSLIAFISNLLIVLAIFRESEHIVFSCLLFIISFFFMQESNLVRQTLAASFVFFSLYYLKRSIFKYLLFVTLAGLVHSSAFIFVLLLLMNFLNFRKYRNVILIFLLFIWGVSLLYLYGFFHSNFIEVTLIFSQLSYGGNSSFVENTAFKHSVLNDVMNLAVLLVFVYYLIYNRRAKLDVLLILFTFGPIFYNLGGNNFHFFRFSCYFMPAMVVVLPNVLYRYSFKGLRNTHLIYYIYMLWNISILIRGYIFSDSPLYFTEIYPWAKFFLQS